MSVQSVIAYRGVNRRRFAAIRQTAANLAAGTFMLGAFVYFMFGLIEPDLAGAPESAAIIETKAPEAVSFLPLRNDSVSREFLF